MIGIYKITNKLNGKSYIGQSRNINRRWQSHKRDCFNLKKQSYLYNSMRANGIENFSFEIIKECKTIELNKWEKYFIKKFKSNDPKYGYNMTDGGDFDYSRKYSITRKGFLNPCYGRKQTQEEKEKRIKTYKETIKNMDKEKFRERHKKVGEKQKNKEITQEQRAKISKSLKEFFKTEKGKEQKEQSSKINKGKKVSAVSREKLKKSLRKYFDDNCKHIFQYDLQGNFIKEYFCINELKEQGFLAGCIWSVCQKRSLTYKGFVWRFEYTENKENLIPTKKKRVKYECPSRKKKVYQYDKCYNFIREYKQIKDVELFGYNRGNVIAVCKGKRKYANGFIWSLEELKERIKHESI